MRCVPRCTLRRAGARLAQPLADTSTALALRLYRARADAAARPRLTQHLSSVKRAMADADPAPAAPPKANPDLASDAELAERAAALVAALRSGKSKAQIKAAAEVKFLVVTLEDSRPPVPAHPRTVAALVAAGVGAALLPLIHGASEVGTSAATALCELLYISDAERREVLDNLGIDKVLELLRESNGELQLALAAMLFEFTRCVEWMESLSPDNDLVERAMSLPFLTANAWATKGVLSFVLGLLKRHPRAWHVLVPSRVSLLVRSLSLRFDENPEQRFLLAATACELLQFLQTRDGFDFAIFDEAAVYVRCVELLGDLCRRQVECRSNRPQAEVTRVLMRASDVSPAFRRHIQCLVFCCPGAYVSLNAGVHEICEKKSADASAAVAFLNVLHGYAPAEWFLLDPSFAAAGMRFNTPTSDAGVARGEYIKFTCEVDQNWETPSCVRALAQPLQHQKLAAAVSLASLLYLGDAYRRLLASGDRLEIFVDALVDSAAMKLSEPASAPDFSFWRDQILRQCTSWLVTEVESDNPRVPDDDVAARPATKRARTVSAATLRASDVNVQRRDSTVLLIAGRPFYVFGALLETKSAVLADALSSATTLDPVAIALPNEVPEEQQYALFHAAVELAYTGTIASDVTVESLLPLWCLGDHLQMDELCTWCVERLTPALAKDAALLECAWTAALARPSDALGDACATAWMLLDDLKSLNDRSAMHLLKRVHDGCAAKELVAAQLVRVLRKALLAAVDKDAEAADDPEDEE